MMDRIAVLIPAYNESATIGKVVADFRRELPEATIYVYDNNSTDGTGTLARNAGAIVRREYTQGKGAVIRRMFRDIDAECYIITDADDTYPAKSAREMVRLVREHNADMVIGDRLSSTYFQENKRLFHNTGNNLVRKSINMLFHSNIQDIMTGYRAFSFEFVKTFPVLSQGFEIETEMTIHAIDKHMRTENLVVEYRDRIEGSVSKLNTFNDGIKVLRTIASLYRVYRPLSFFGIIALLLAVIATVFFVPVYIEYLHTGLVPSFPTLIVSGFTMLSAIISYFSGLILDSIRQKGKHDFEMQLHQATAWKKQLLRNSGGVDAAATGSQH